MIVLVTGGLGYIGSHTVVSLYNQGHEVVIIDNLDNSSLDVLKSLELIVNQPLAFYNIDVRDSTALNQLFAKESIEAVIHFAAKKSVSEALQKPLYYYEHNISGLLCILGACEEHKVNRFIFSSSCTVYGEPTILPVTEATPTQIANTPYGNTKRIGEEILQEYSKFQAGFKTILLRYFNPVGAHTSALIGELPNGVPANLMPYITQSAAGLRGPLQIFGTDYPTHDGTAIRDFIHVMDLADAHVKALQYLEQSTHNCDVFNVGTGKGFSVKEVVETFERVNHLSINHIYAPRREGDIAQIWADTTKVNQIMNWSAELNLEEMCRSAWVWQQNIIKHKR